MRLNSLKKEKMKAHEWVPGFPEVLYAAKEEHFLLTPGRILSKGYDSLASK